LGIKKPHFNSLIAMEKTLVIIKPGTIQRGYIGEIIQRFEKKGLQLCGMKMVQLDEKILLEHYAHLAHRPFFGRIKDAMMITPVIVCCWKGIDAIRIVRAMAGVTNGRDAAPGTIRGDYSVSVQENIVHASDSPETAATELKRFFDDEEIFDYKQHQLDFLYANDEI
jgi:nucleoside-diphosphate kinase